jgi:hypothetical protein
MRAIGDDEIKPFPFSELSVFRGSRAAGGACAWAGELGRGEKTGPRRNLSRIITFISHQERRIIVQVNIMIMVVCGAFVDKRARAQNVLRATVERWPKGLTG